MSDYLEARGQRCPDQRCQSVSRVVRSRVRVGYVLRRRECLVCQHRWSTAEVRIMARLPGLLASLGVDLDPQHLADLDLP